MQETWPRVGALAFLLLCVGFCAGQTTLVVDEDRIRIHLLPEPVLEIPLVNPTGETVEGHFRMEMLVRGEGIVSSREGSFRAAPGISVATIHWPAKELSDSPSEIGWYRLRYRFEPKDPTGIQPVRGVVQVGRFLTDAFELRLTAASGVVSGAKYPVRVRVNNPANGHAYSGVPVELELVIEQDDDQRVTRRVTTDG